MTWPLADGRVTSVIHAVIPFLLITAYLDPIKGLKCHVGSQAEKNPLPESQECPAPAKYCCSDIYYGINNGHYYSERYCAEDNIMMDGTTPAACRNMSHSVVALEQCCCEGELCNHGDTTMDYMLAGMPLFDPTRCNAVWRPPFGDSGDVVGIVYSKQMANFGYDNGTTIRVKCPPDADKKRWKADFDPAAVCVNGKWIAAAKAVNCDWSYET